MMVARRAIDMLRGGDYIKTRKCGEAQFREKAKNRRGELLDLTNGSQPFLAKGKSSKKKKSSKGTCY